MTPIPEVTDIEVAFPTTAMAFLPPMEEIPPEFKGLPGKSRWCQVAYDWFYHGLAKAKWTRAGHCASCKYASATGHLRRSTRWLESRA